MWLRAETSSDLEKRNLTPINFVVVVVFLLLLGLLLSLLLCCIHAIYFKYSKSGNSFLFTKYVQNTKSWAQPAGGHRSPVHWVQLRFFYRWGCYSTRWHGHSGLWDWVRGFWLLQWSQGSVGIWRERGESRNGRLLQYSRRSLLMVSCPVSRTTFIKVKKQSSYNWV